MNLGDSLNMMTGLTSSAYNSILGNSLSQNILGSQISNSFGKKSEVFIDGIRLLEKIKVDKDTNLIDYEPTGKSRALETAQWLASLGGYVVFTGLLERKKDEEGRKVWAGLTKMNVGDVAELNYMGDNLNVYRAVNRLTYNKPIQDAEDFEHTQKRLLTFYMILWGAALITSLVFVQYSVTVAVDQSLAENKEWQLANMAMQIAQIIALTLIGMYESKFLLDLATEERAEAYLESNQLTLQAFQTEMDNLEQRMGDQINSLSLQLNTWQATSTQQFQDLADAVKKQAEAFAQHKKEIEEKLQNDMKKLKENLEGQLAELEKASATKVDVEELKKETKAKLDALEKDIQDNKKNTEEAQKRWDDAQTKSDKKIDELTTTVPDLVDGLDVNKKATEAIVSNVEVIQDDVKKLEEKVNNLKVVNDASLKGMAKRAVVNWFLPSTEQKSVQKLRIVQGSP